MIGMSAQFLQAPLPAQIAGPYMYLELYDAQHQLVQYLNTGRLPAVLPQTGSCYVIMFDVKPLLFRCHKTSISAAKKWSPGSQFHMHGSRPWFSGCSFQLMVWYTQFIILLMLVVSLISISVSFPVTRLSTFFFHFVKNLFL